MQSIRGTCGHGPELGSLRQLIELLTAERDDINAGLVERYAELARLRAEVERLGDVLSRYTDALIAKDTRIEEDRAEVEKLRADVVWAVRHGACAGYDGSSWPCISYAPSGTETYEHNKTLDQVEYNGTDASLLSAVRRAREATDGLA